MVDADSTEVTVIGEAMQRVAAHKLADAATQGVVNLIMSHESSILPPTRAHTRHFANKGVGSKTQRVDASKSGLQCAEVVVNER